MFRLTFILTLVLGCIASLYAIDNISDEKQRYVRILTGNVGSFSYALGSALSVSLSLPKTVKCVENCGVAGLLVSALSSPSDRDSLQAILTKKTHSGFVALDSLWNSKISNQQRAQLRIISPLHHQSLMVITHKNSHVKEILDLKGKKIFFDMANTSKMNLVRDFFDHIGLKKEDYQPSQGYYQQALHAFKQQDLDALVLFRAVPDHFLTSLSHDMPINIIGFDTHHINAIKEKYNYLHHSVIPAPYYHHDKDIHSIAIPILWVTHQDQHKNVIFDMTKKFWQSYHDQPIYYQQLKRQMPILPKIHYPQNKKTLGLKYHQGALAFYQQNHVNMIDAYQ